MKKYLFPVLALVILASCSAPKYTYHFDTYDYNKSKNSVARAEVIESSEESPIVVDNQSLIASTSEQPVYLAETPVVVTADATKVEPLSKAEKKALRKEAVKSIKEYVKAVKAGEKEKAEEMAKAMDSDLKWAAIFGAIGVVSLIIGGDVFYIIGGIAMIVAVVFLVKWIIRQ